MVGKVIMVDIEHVLGRIINREHDLRKVFAAAFMQGLRHLDAHCCPGTKIPFAYFLKSLSLLS